MILGVRLSLPRCLWPKVRALFFFFGISPIDGDEMILAAGRIR